MPQIQKIGNYAFKFGNYFLGYSGGWSFGNSITPITQAQGNFTTCSKIAIDYPSSAFPNGRVFITNYGNNTISILNYSSPNSGVYTTITQAQGNFSGCNAIAIDPPTTAFPNGRIFVVNYSNNSVSVLNYSNPTSGVYTTITQSQGNFSGCSRIAIDYPSSAFSNGRILVVNAVNDTISILNYSSPNPGVYTTITQAQGNFSGIQNITVDATSNRIFVLNNTGNNITMLNYSSPNAGSPTMISASQGGLSGIQALVVDSANNRIFISNASNNNISILNYTLPNAGNPVYISSISGSLSTPVGIAFDTTNNKLYAVNQGNNTVSVLMNKYI